MARSKFTEDELDKIRQLRERFWKWYGPMMPSSGPSYICQPVMRFETDNKLLDRWLMNDGKCSVGAVMSVCNKLHQFLRERAW